MNLDLKIEKIVTYSTSNVLYEFGLKIYMNIFQIKTLFIVLLKSYLNEIEKY